MSRDVKRWLGLFAILGAVATVIFFFVTRPPGRELDPVAWSDEAQVKQGVRQEMADRLLFRKALIGKTRDEVIELLGEPSPSNRYANRPILVYWLGPERSLFSLDPEFLILRLGEDGRVVHNRIGK